jgi:hypothetical protein
MEYYEPPIRKASFNRKKTLKRNKSLYTKAYNTDMTYNNEELPEESIPILYEIFSKYAPLSKIATSCRNFYDIGCSSGKVVIGMTQLNSLLHGIGIEVVQEKIVLANTALQYIRDESLRKRIEFLCISMNDQNINYSNACWVFISNEFFNDDENNYLIDKLAYELQRGSIIICSKQIYNDKFQELNYMSLPMSMSTDSKVFIYCKINH